MVPADSDRVSPAPPYSGYPPFYLCFAYGTITLFGRSFQNALLASIKITQVLQPRRVNPSVWAFPRSLATTYGIINYFLFLRLLRCFSSAGYRLCLWAFSPAGSPIRTSLDHRSLAPPQSFSQLATSFVVVESQGIPHAPLSCFHVFAPLSLHSRLFCSNSLVLLSLSFTLLLSSLSKIFSKRLSRSVLLAF
jgi:hypothetical protein